VGITGTPNSEQAAEGKRAQVLAAVRAAFDPYVDGGVVRATGATGMVAARA
jgi:hypothetical protein